GTGYPNGLSGDAIPLGSRLLRVADAFERAYSAANDDESAADVLDELEAKKGTSLDPFLFEIFREEVAVHLQERRRQRVTLQAQRRDATAALR
ncbi:MAG TPA: HD domain-containing phosphohydrolase, partial [Planctomycetota bacterium]|nr:HD domain-containing phosphohydrolase [Planctomycetota bacterium]